MSMSQAKIRACWASQPPKAAEGIRSLKLTNETNWNTADLRRWLAAGLRSMNVSMARNVRVYRARAVGDNHHGWAFYSSRMSRLGIPNPGENVDNLPIDWRKAAQIFEHEIQHNLGLRHGHMPKWWNLPATWWNSVEVRPKAVRAPRVIDKDAARHLTVEKAIARWTRKEKLAKTKLASWRRKLKYIEKKRAALSTKPTKQTP